ncbi:MAG: DEAD/DEAH box helicase family protein [Bacteroidales bacterium]|nr:DEAD/DEAH box helicase family protein [Bacteroidales bacterium]
MTNFDYLRDIEPLHDLYTFCQGAEASMESDHDACALHCRRGLEWLVKAIYTLKNAEIGERKPLFELMTGEPFVTFIDDDRLMAAAHYIRRVGNIAAHAGGVKSGEAYFCLLNLYNLVGGTLLKLRFLSSLAPFNRTLIPKTGVRITPRETVPVPVHQFVESVPAEAVASKTPAPVLSDYSEFETRRLFIDLMLRDAGWELVGKDNVVLPNKAGTEIEVHGMPAQDIGYADYVLYGSDGKPLAVIEAKRTSKDPVIGKHQAELYAQCLKEQYGILPVIYYTNGFQTFVIDGLGYPPRQILGFHSQEDLLVIHRSRGRAAITDTKVKDHITDREYQKRAIHSICDHFNKMHRRGLLVMATGSGKTRVSISLCDVLIRNKWVKNVLFLADRNALVEQAYVNFEKLLPDYSKTRLDMPKPDLSARFIFSTYQTMIGYIDSDKKNFSVGRFDLIIIDEAHRSVFGKYTAILDYFDALMVGLTATPREDVDRSTYELFGLDGEPNFAYELAEAVDDKYLVNFVVMNRTSKHLREGIKYKELTAEQKGQFEDIWKYEAARSEEGAAPTPRDIRSSEIIDYIYNEKTIDLVLEDLITTGLTVNGGDTIGKTIIFAHKHEHAVKIVERFQKQYPEYGSDFCVLIDNQVTKAQDLINSFEVRGKMPQIVVSVDMMDTGIDVPDVLNLVFFKQVKSKIKFWQMVGRGTRKSPDVHGEGLDKQYFTIYDWCGNFDFFDVTPEGEPLLPMVSVTERLFDLRVDMALALQHAQYQQDPFARSLHDDIKKTLRTQVLALSDQNITVRRHWEVVDKFRKEESWVCLSDIDALDLKDQIAPIIIRSVTDNSALRFDILILNIQLAQILPDHQAGKSMVRVTEIAKSLQSKATIQQVKDKIAIVNEVANPDFWKSATLDKLETVRIEMRDLVQFIKGDKKRNFTINVPDIIEYKDAPKHTMPTLTYKERVIDFISKNRHHPVLEKIRSLQQLTQQDILALENICWKDLGTKEEYQAYVRRGGLICGDSVAAFIRSIIHVDRSKALELYSKYLTASPLNPEQEEYLKSVLDYVSLNGDIQPATLYHEEPFSEWDLQSFFNTDTPAFVGYIRQLHNVIGA